MREYQIIRLVIVIDFWRQDEEKAKETMMEMICQKLQTMKHRNRFMSLASINHHQDNDWAQINCAALDPVVGGCPKQKPMMIMMLLLRNGHYDLSNPFVLSSKAFKFDSSSRVCVSVWFYKLTPLHLPNITSVRPLNQSSTQATVHVLPGAVARHSSTMFNEQ